MGNSKFDSLTNEQKEKFEKFGEIYNDNELKLPSGNVYTFTKLNHKKRLKVFARFQSLERQGMMFFDSPDFEVVERIIEDCVLVDGMQLSKKQNHWDEHTADFLTFYTYAMGAISYPFLQGGS